VSGRTIREIFEQPLADRLMRVGITEPLQSGQARTFTYALDVPAGRKHFEAHSMPMATMVNGKKTVVVAARDITERVLAERRQRRDAERMAFMLELSRLEQMDERSVFEFLLDHTIELTESAQGCFQRLDDDGNVVSAFSRCPNASMPANGAAPVWVECLDKKRLMVVNHAVHPTALASSLERYACFPLMEGEIVRFVICVANKPDSYDETDVLQLELIAAHTQDFWDRRWVKEALRDSEARRAKAEQVSHLGSWEVDLVSGKTIWSEEFYRICGLEPHSVAPTQELGVQMIHPDDRERALAEVQRAVEQRDRYQIEKRICRPGRQRAARRLHRRGHRRRGAKPDQAGGLLSRYHRAQRSRARARATSTAARGLGRPAHGSARTLAQSGAVADAGRDRTAPARRVGV
jgi:PAS domain-containing protein